MRSVSTVLRPCTVCVRNGGLGVGIWSGLHTAAVDVHVPLHGNWTSNADGGWDKDWRRRWVALSLVVWYRPVPHRTVGRWHAGQKARSVPLLLQLARLTTHHRRTRPGS